MISSRRLLAWVPAVCLGLSGLIVLAPAAQASAGAASVQAAIPAAAYTGQDDIENMLRDTIIAISKDSVTSKTGIQYVWAGGHASKPGPSKGSCSNYEGPTPCKDDTKVGLDCSGYVRWILYQAGFADFGSGITAQGFRTTSRLRTVSKANAKPGDLVIFGPSSKANHVAIYAGNGYMYESKGHADDIVKSKVSERSDVLSYRTLF